MESEIYIFWSKQFNFNGVIYLFPSEAPRRRLSLIKSSRLNLCGLDALQSGRSGPRRRQLMQSRCFGIVGRESAGHRDGDGEGIGPELPDPLLQRLVPLQRLHVADLQLGLVLQHTLLLVLPGELQVISHTWSPFTNSPMTSTLSCYHGNRLHQRDSLCVSCDRKKMCHEKKPLVEVEMRSGREVVVQQEFDEFGAGLLTGQELVLGEHGGERATQVQVS